MSTKNIQVELIRRLPALVIVYPDGRGASEGMKGAVRDLLGADLPRLRVVVSAPKSATAAGIASAIRAAAWPKENPRKGVKPTVKRNPAGSRKQTCWKYTGIFGPFAGGASHQLSGTISATTYEAARAHALSKLGNLQKLISIESEPCPAVARRKVKRNPFTGQGWPEERAWIAAARATAPTVVTPARARQIMDAARAKAVHGPWSDQLSRVMTKGEYRYLNDLWATMPASYSFVSTLNHLANSDRSNPKTRHTDRRAVPRRNPNHIGWQKPTASLKKWGVDLVGYTNDNYRYEIESETVRGTEYHEVYIMPPPGSFGGGVREKVGTRGTLTLAKTLAESNYERMVGNRTNPRARRNPLTVNPSRKAGAYALFVKGHIRKHLNAGLSAPAAMKAVAAEWRAQKAGAMRANPRKRR